MSRLLSPAIAVVIVFAGGAANADTEGEPEAANTEPRAAAAFEPSPSGLTPLAPRATPEPARDQPATKEKAPGADVSHFEVGALGGLAFPRVLGVEGFVRFEKIVALGLEYGVVPKISVGGVDAVLSALAADARIFPFGGAFFIGARAGRQHLGMSAAVTAQVVGTLQESLTVDTWFVNPRVGFLWNWGALAVGINAGVQIPVSSTSASNASPSITDTSTIASLESTARRQALPTIDFLQAGLVF